MAVQNTPERVLAEQVAEKAERMMGVSSDPTGIETGLLAVTASLIAIETRLGQLVTLLGKPGATPEDIAEDIRGAAA